MFMLRGGWGEEILDIILSAFYWYSNHLTVLLKFPDQICCYRFVNLVLFISSSAVLDLFLTPRFFIV